MRWVESIFMSYNMCLIIIFFKKNIILLRKNQKNIMLLKEIIIIIINIETKAPSLIITQAKITQDIMKLKYMVEKSENLYHKNDY